VIDESGRPVGVISRTDIVVYERRKFAAPSDPFDPHERSDLDAPARDPLAWREATDVCDLMTPALFSVWPETEAEEVAKQMVDQNVHRLFVVDRDGVLVGVISALDLLRHFCGRS